MSPKKKPELPIDVYVRVSRTDGRDVEADGGTAAEQERRCRAQLEASGLTAGEVFADLDESGGKESRPEFDRMLARGSDGDSGGVVVLNLSRFGRHGRVAQDIIELEKAGATVVSVEEKLDTSTPSGRFALTILSAVNSYYLDNVTVGWQRVHHRKWLEGVRVGVAPAGYDRDAAGRLVQNADAPAVRRAFEMAANGTTLAAVVRHLNAEGVVTSGERAGKAPGWSTGGLRKVLENRAYLGELACTCGCGGVSRPHQALVTSWLWERAKVPKGPPRRGAAETGRRPAWELAGLVRCGTCGGRMSRDHTGRPGGKVYEFARCKNAKCGAPATAGMGLLEDAAMAAFEDFVVGLELGSEPDEGRLMELDAALQAARADLGDVEAEHEAGGLSPVAYGKALTAAEGAVEEAEAAVAEEQRRGVWHFPTPEALREAHAALTPEARAEALREAFEALVVHRGRGPLTDRVVLGPGGEVAVEQEGRLEVRYAGGWEPGGVDAAA